jgi:hypothetical protein
MADSSYDNRKVLNMTATKTRFKIELYDERTGTWDRTFFNDFDEIIKWLRREGRYKIIGVTIRCKDSLLKMERLVEYRVKRGWKNG